MNQDELRELKAYKMGYDLGWFRAIESIKPLLDELMDCINNSSAFKQMEEEKYKKPVFCARIFAIIAELNQIHSEQMPTLVLEQKAINDMGKRLATLTIEDWKMLSQQDNSSLDLSEERRLEDGTADNATEV